MSEAMCRYRRMQPEDIPSVVHIERLSFGDPWSAAGFARALQTPGNLYVAAFAGEELAGYCGLYRSFEEGEIVNVAVHPARRRNGIGEEMLRFLLAEGEQAGITRFILEVRVGNEGAIRLYEKLGFTRLGIRRDFYEAPREDALIMERRR